MAGVSAKVDCLGQEVEIVRNERRTAAVVEEGERALHKKLRKCRVGKRKKDEAQERPCVELKRGFPLFGLDWK